MEETQENKGEEFDITNIEHVQLAIDQHEKRQAEIQKEWGKIEDQLKHLRKTLVSLQPPQNEIVYMKVTKENTDEELAKLMQRSYDDDFVKQLADSPKEDIILDQPDAWVVKFKNGYGIRYRVGDAKGVIFSLNHLALGEAKWKTEEFVLYEENCFEDVTGQDVELSPDGDCMYKVIQDKIELKPGFDPNQLDLDLIYWVVNVDSLNIPSGIDFAPGSSGLALEVNGKLKGMLVGCYTHTDELKWAVFLNVLLIYKINMLKDILFDVVHYLRHSLNYDSDGLELYAENGLWRDHVKPIVEPSLAYLVSATAGWNRSTMLKLLERWDANEDNRMKGYFTKLDTTLKAPTAENLKDHRPDNLHPQVSKDNLADFEIICECIVYDPKDHMDGCSDDMIQKARKDWKEQFKPHILLQWLLFGRKPHKGDGYPEPAKSNTGGCWWPFSGWKYRQWDKLAKICNSHDLKAHFPPSDDGVQYFTSDVPLMSKGNLLAANDNLDDSLVAHHPVLCEIFNGDEWGIKSYKHICWRPTHMMIANSSTNSNHTTLRKRSEQELGLSYDDDVEKRIEKLEKLKKAKNTNKENKQNKANDDEVYFDFRKLPPSEDK